MPFFIRKALSFGPIRFNLSKSGVGVSAGVKGLRLGSGPAGNYIHAGRHGLYYKKFFSGKSDNKTHSNDTIFVNEESNDETIIDSGCVLNMLDSKSKDLINELNTKNKLTSYLPITVILSIITNFIFYLFFSDSLLDITIVYILQFFLVGLSLYLCVSISKKDVLKKTTVLFFEIDDDLEKIYEKFYNSIEKLSESKKISNVFKKSEVSSYDRKYNAGAGELIEKTDVQIYFKNPAYLKTNIDPPCFPAGNELLFFLPTTLLVYKGKDVGAVSYNEIKISKNKVRFIEQDQVPSDANIVDSTWAKVNKDGGPDRRFANNRELPIVEYDVLKIESPSGLNEMFYISKIGLTEDFITNINNLKKYYKSTD